MLRSCHLSVIAGCALSIAGVASTADAQTVPGAPPDRVVDQAGVLSGDQREALLDVIWRLDAQTGAEIGVCIQPTSRAVGPELYALRVFNTWHIGKAGSDNGVLFLLLTEDRDVRILPGIRYERLLDEREAGRILDEAVVPRLRDGQPGQAVLEGVRQIADVVRNFEHPVELPVEAEFPRTGGFGGGEPRSGIPPPPRRQGTPLSPAEIWWNRNAWKVIIGALIGLAVVVYVVSFLSRPKCLQCRKRRLGTQNRVVTPATAASSGTSERVTDCGACGYHLVETFVLPKQVLAGYPEPPRFCAQCKQPLIVTERTIDTPSQDMSGTGEWTLRCSKCDYQAVQPFYVPKFARIGCPTPLSKCPGCQKDLVVQEKMLVPVSQESSGKGEWTFDCKACGHHRVETFYAKKFARSGYPEPPASCSTCQKPLMVTERTVKIASYGAAGSGEWSLRCDACGFQQLQAFDIPRVVKYDDDLGGGGYHRHHSSSHHHSSSSSHSSHHSSSSHRSGGGGGFGGGRSRGGGAGRKW